MAAAKAALAALQSVSAFELSNVQGAFTTATSSIGATARAIQAVQKDLNPNVPPPLKEIEHSTWYIDWTSNDYAIPEGINTVNIFVGNIDAQGNPYGFGNMGQLIDHTKPYDPETNPTKMEKFVAECHDKGIAVKISIGGGGGSYDHLWTQLTASNVGDFAQKLVDYCHDNHIDGVDFDCEEFHSPTDRPELQNLVGQYIKEFKSRDPNLLSTLCTNAGFGEFFPWPGIVQNIFEGASTIDPTTGEKSCAVDKLYIMSYYDPINNEKGWIEGWSTWLSENYNYSPVQVVVGLDDFDAHAYDIKEFAAWAAEKGFSTGYWAWDPALGRSEKSSQSAHDIEDAYNRNT